MAGVTSLGHVGIAVRDLGKMLDFYTRVLGLTITDGDPEHSPGIFLSADPVSEHHEFVMGVAPDRNTNAQQISFTVATIDELRDLYHAIKAEGSKIERVVNHGIAFGCYFRDPENNHVEVYWSTGIDYPQPHGDPIDLDLSNAELLRILDAMPPKESEFPRYYGRDVGKRLPAKVAAN